MGTSAATIGRWLDELYANENYTHMVVFVDTWDYTDYPVYVKTWEDVRKVAKSGSMTRVMEVYSRNHTKEAQLKQARAFNYD